MDEELYLPVTVGGVTFKNPFFVASGPTTKSLKQLRRIEETGWAGASIKLTIDPAPYINRQPRYALFKDRGALAFTAEHRLTFTEGLKLMEDAKKELKELLIAANITYAGDKGAEGWVNMAKKFEEVGADIIELNMCCPNMSYNVELTGEASSLKARTGASLGQDPNAVSEIVKAIKENIKIPLFVKLTPEGGKIAKVARSLYAAGADSVGGTSNRLAIPPIDLENPTKAVYHLQEEPSMSCHCGHYIKPLALRDTYEIRRVNGPDVKIHMAGGITNANDALEMVMCGADLIGICSETLINGYDIVRPIIKGMKEYLAKHDYKDLHDIRDIVVPVIKSAPELTIYGGYAKIKEPHLAAPCKVACPFHVPVQAYVQKVAKKDYRAAYDLIMGKSPLQSICSYVCNHKCEDECTRGVIGRPIPIKAIKRFVLEYAKKEGWNPIVKSPALKDEKVAVIGSGPAGLSCAYALAQAGYHVTVFEKENYLGGMLRYALPKFRTPHDVLDEEIDTIRKMGVTFVTGRTYGKDITVASLKEVGFSSIFLGIGAQKSYSINVPNENADGVIPALDFLKGVYDEKVKDIGKNVVVIGGGFTAVDSARTARRLGAEEVYIAYRRTKDEMPASKDEIAEAEAEGVKIMYLVAPKEIEVKDGKVTGIKMVNQVLGKKDASNRRKPEEVESAEFVLPCDTVITAIGQKPVVSEVEVNKRGMISSDPETGLTSVAGVYAGGDAVNVDSVISAIAAGRRAACSIDKYISNDKATLDYEPDYPVVNKEDVLRRNGYFKDEDGVDLHTRSGSERIKDFDICTRALTEDEAVAEAGRCLKCGCGEGCGLCANICSNFAIDKKECDTWKINPEECVACGMCFNRCPNHNIEIVETHEIIK